MSLAKISGQVKSITNGSAIGNKLSSELYGDNSFLRNEQGGFAQAVDAIRSIIDIGSNIADAAGQKNSMYKIGEIPANGGDWGDGFFGKAAAKLQSKVATAISYWGLSNDENYQKGVIIDGFDNFKGDISVALPDNPIIYETSITDHVVRNPNRLTMRIYVDLMHSDDIVDNLKQAALNSLGGLTNIVAGALGMDMNRVQQALNNLKYIQERGHPFKVYTPHGVYENMMIERIVPTNDQKMNEILAADITFKEIVPTRPLGSADKTTARTPPTAAASNFAKARGWVK